MSISFKVRKAGKEIIESCLTLGIDSVSLTEGIDTSTPLGEAMFSIIGAMAQLERDLIRERVTAGMKRARDKGKALGRPKKAVDPVEFARLRGKGLNMDEIAQAVGVSRATLFGRQWKSKKGCRKRQPSGLTIQQLTRGELESRKEYLF